MSAESFYTKHKYFVWSFFIIYMLLVCSLLLLFSSSTQTTPVHMIPLAQHNDKQFRIQQDTSFLPDNFSTDFVEIFTDLFWDFDGSSGFPGLIPLALSYIPYFGSNGSVFIDVIFYFSIFGGIVVVIKFLQQYR